MIAIGCSVLTGTSIRVMSFGLIASSPRKSRIILESIPTFGKVIPSLQIYGSTQGFPVSGFHPRQKLFALNEKWSKLAKNYPELISSAFLLILEDGRYAELNSNLPLPANHLIKLPLALIITNQLDHGYINLNTTVNASHKDISGETKDLQTSIDNSRTKINEMLVMMIKMNNPIECNRLIQYLKKEIDITKELQKLNFDNIYLESNLPDIKGINTISTRDLVHLKSNLTAGENMGLYIRDLLKDTLITSLQLNVSTGNLSKDLQRKQYIQTNGFPTKGTTVYSKTEQSSITYADSGLVVLPNGQHMIAIFVVRGPLNNNTSKSLIQDMIFAAIPILEFEGNSHYK